jgi:hypothetical protein
MRVSVVGIEYNNVLEHYRHTLRSLEEGPLKGRESILYLPEPLEFMSTVELMIGVPEHVAKRLE